AGPLPLQRAAVAVHHQDVVGRQPRLVAAGGGDVHAERVVGDLDRHVAAGAEEPAPEGELGGGLDEDLRGGAEVRGQGGWRRHAPRSTRSRRGGQAYRTSSNEPTTSNPCPGGSGALPGRTTTRVCSPASRAAAASSTTSVRNNTSPGGTPSEATIDA